MTGGFSDRETSWGLKTDFITQAMVMMLTMNAHKVHDHSRLLPSGKGVRMTSNNNSLWRRVFISLFHKMSLDFQNQGLIAIGQNFTQ